MTTPIADSTRTSRSRRIIGRVVTGGFALVVVALGAYCATDELARGRADRARNALHPGDSCRDVLAVAQRYATPESVEEVNRACSRSAATRVTLNFRKALSLNYLVNVDLSSDGRVVRTSGVGAW
jgi:hypothetical protein